MFSTRSDSLPLGKRVATYYPRLDRFRITAVSASFISGLGLLGVTRALVSPSTVGIAISLSVFMAGVAVMIYLWVRRTRRVHLHQQGFHLQQAGSSQTVRWDEVCDVWQTPTNQIAGKKRAYPNWTIRLQLIDGRKIKLDGFEGAKAIGSRAQRILVDRLFGHYRQAFEAGSWVRFGKKLAISDEGLTVGLKAFSWYEVNEILLDEDDGIRIGICRETTEWIYLPIGSVSNFQLLGQLLTWVKSNQSLTVDDAERAANESRSVGLFNSPSECDVSNLVASGYEWDEIDDVMNGECSIEELMERGPRKRRRVPK